MSAPQFIAVWGGAPQAAAADHQTIYYTPYLKPKFSLQENNMISLTSQSDQTIFYIASEKTFRD